jgi:hypothetical protein
VCASLALTRLRLTSLVAPQPAGHLTSQRGYCGLVPFGPPSARALFVLGGGDGGRWYDGVERYDLATRSWARCAPLCVPRGSLAAAALGDAVFAFGGGHTAATAPPGGGPRATLGLAVAERYDPATDAWAPLAPLSVGRFCVGGAALGGALYAVGGFDGAAYLSSAERYDPRQGRWSPVAPMASKRGSLAVTPSPDGQLLLAIGGFHGSGFLGTVEAYEPRADAWRALAPLPAPRAYGAAAAADGAVWLLGGLDGKHHAEVAEMYDVRTDTWRAWAPPAASSLVRKRAFVAAAVLDM